jgi:hypothetical protein
MSQDEFEHSMRGSIIGAWIVCQVRRGPSLTSLLTEATEGLESIRNLKSLLERMRNVENKQKVCLGCVVVLLLPGAELSISGFTRRGRFAHRHLNCVNSLLRQGASLHVLCIPPTLLTLAYL